MQCLRAARMQMAAANRPAGEFSILHMGRSDVGVAGQEWCLDRRQKGRGDAEAWKTDERSRSSLPDEVSFLGADGRLVKLWQSRRGMEDGRMVIPWPKAEVMCRNSRSLGISGRK